MKPADCLNVLSELVKRSRLGVPYTHRKPMLLMPDTALKPTTGDSFVHDTVKSTEPARNSRMAYSGAPVRGCSVAKYLLNGGGKPPSRAKL